VVSTNKDGIEPIDRLKRKAHKWVRKESFISHIGIGMKEFVGRFSGIGLFQLP
jgi:hypothetical protein